MNTLSSILLTDTQGLLAFLLRLVLLPVYLLVMVVVSFKNAIYDAGLWSPSKVDATVVSVGNITVGGTGKTPLVIALARRAVKAGHRVAVVMRGYGGATDDAGTTDEVALVKARVPEVEVVVGPDKLTAARQAAEAGADLVIVDDGMQHRRLHRDTEVVVVDARAPLGNGFVLPWGSLREPPAGLGRADVVVLTHLTGMTDDEVDAMVQQVRSHRREVPVVRAHHVPLGVRGVAETEVSDLDALVGRELFLFCGIASPEGFQRTVEEAGGTVTGVAAFGDHHAFTPDDLAEVRSRARTAQLVCTEKDAAKVARIPGCEDVLCLVIDLELLDPLPALPGLDG